MNRAENADYAEDNGNGNAHNHINFNPGRAEGGGGVNMKGVEMIEVVQRDNISVEEMPWRTCEF